MKKPNAITVFVERLKKIGIEVKLFGNYPWVYLHEVNGRLVVEKQNSDHYFTLAFLPIKLGDEEIKFTDLDNTFKIIRKYAKTKY